MKEQVTLQGRSFTFNALLIALNLGGLTCVLLGYQPSFEEHSTLLKTIGIVALMSSIGGLIVFKGRLMMASVARILVGGLFIVSGLVKANDPLGFAYKLEEYFEDGALAYRIKELFGAPGFSLEFLIDSALGLSILICIVEVILGVLLIIGGKIKMTSYLLVGMMLFFTFLTWHTANCDHDLKFEDHDTYLISDSGEKSIAELKIGQAKHQDSLAKKLKNSKEPLERNVWVVSNEAEKVIIAEMKSPQCVDDCGCFGDAMKGSVGRSLTPSESLWKDLVLLYLVVWIFLAQWRIAPNNSKQNLVYLITSLVVVGFFSWVFSWYFPLFFSAIACIGSLWVLRAGGKYLGNYWGAILFVTGITSLLVTYTLTYSPIKDYRPYAIGSDLKAKMNDGVNGEYQNMVVYSNVTSGKKKEFDATSAEYTSSEIWEDKNWKYDTMMKKVIVEPRNPSIMDFDPYINVSEVGADELDLPFMKAKLAASKTKYFRVVNLVKADTIKLPANDYSIDSFPVARYSIIDTLIEETNALSQISAQEFILNAEKIVILVSRELGGANWYNMERFKEIMAESEKMHVPVIMICNARDRQEINNFRSKHKIGIPVFVMDGIELKIISRSNPALLILEKGVVKGKYPYRLFPKKENFNNMNLRK